MRYSVGDVITVRSWKSLHNEYGTNSDGLIVCGVYFDKCIGRKICGRTFDIKVVNADGRYIIFDGFDYWVILDNLVF